MDKNEIATVLEDAARLYKDEKVAWCSGSWVEGPNYWDVPEEEVVVSACAEGAILRASGFTWEQVESYEGEDGVMRARDAKAHARFLAARDTLGRHLLAHREEYLVHPAAVEYKPVLVDDIYHRTPDMVAVSGWNDELVSRIVDKYFIEDDVSASVSASASASVSASANIDFNAQAKSLVIDAMEATAKDLRNG